MKLNQWIGEGMIITDFNLRHTKGSSRPVLNLILSVVDNYKSKKNVDGDYAIKKRYAKIPLVVWHKKAEYIYNNFERGDLVRVQGALRTRVLDKDGHPTHTFEIVVSEMILIKKSSRS
tara:strand:+ start:101 stop:454 length:354 start_codon:yes stop_codon:yes gene_type:complete